MWGFQGGNYGGDKWRFSANLVGIFCRNLPATLDASSKRGVVGDTSQVLTEDEFIAEAILISVTESNINRGKFNKFNRLNEFIVCVSFFKN